MPVNPAKYQQTKFNDLNKRINRVVLSIEEIFTQFNLEAAGLTINLDYDGTKPFMFSDYPETKKKINALKGNFANNLDYVIVSSTRNEWERANVEQDELANEILRSFGVDDPKTFSRYFQKNTEALNSFVKRKTKGMNLSDRVWELSEDYVQELEVCLSKGIEKGTSAVTLSKRISKYLKDFEKIKSDYTDMFGNKVKIADCEYRSMRLARSEINMAYRNADVLRWRQMDFVVGYEVKRSQREYACSVCESLKGKYPKSFTFASWHPNCLCYVIPILCSEEEFWNDEKESVNRVTDVPAGFKQWVANNSDRIVEAKKVGTLPWFLKDNPDRYETITSTLEKYGEHISKVKASADLFETQINSFANKFGFLATPVNIKSDYRIAEKAIRDYNGDVSMVLDIIRTTVVTRGDNLNKMIDELKDNFSVVRHKIQNTHEGYTGHILNVRLGEGVIAEVQANIPQVIYGKSKRAQSIIGDELFNYIKDQSGLEPGLAHDMYKEIRILHKEKNEKRIFDLSKKSSDYYNKLKAVKL